MQAGNIKNNYFEKKRLSMVLNLTVYVRNVISFFYKQKTRWNSDIYNFFWRKIQFCPIFHWKLAIWTKSAIMTSVWRHTRDVCILLYIWKEGPHKHTMVPRKHTSGVYFLRNYPKFDIQYLEIDQPLYGTYLVSRKYTIDFWQWWADKTGIIDTCTTFGLLNGSQLAKMKKSIPDMSLPLNI